MNIRTLAIVPAAAALMLCSCSSADSKAIRTEAPVEKGITKPVVVIDAGQPGGGLTLLNYFT